MTTKEIIKLLEKRGYEVIHTSDNIGYCIIPQDPHSFWDRVDNDKELETYYMKLIKLNDVDVVKVDNKIVYHIPTTFDLSLKYMAGRLNELGYDVIVFNVKRGEHHCKVFCKDLSVNLENVILDNGKKRMTFGKFIHPFEKEWSGYYVGGYNRR